MNLRLTYVVEEDVNSSRDERFNIIEVDKAGNRKAHSSFPRTEKEAREYVDYLNSRYSLGDYDSDEIKEFYNKADFQELADAINNKFGFDLKFKWELDKPDRFGQLRSFNFYSDSNLVETNPILKTAFRKFTVGSFCNSISVARNTGELFLFITIDYHYEQHGGGSNGVEIARATYSEKGWDIRFNMDDE